MRFFTQSYALLHRRHRPEDIALTPEGRGLLMHLAWAGPMTIGELARHAGRAQSVVSESVAVLESHGMLARVRDPRDQRRTLVWLTDGARKWMSEQQEPLDRERLAAVIAAMNPADRAQLIDSCDRFIATAEQLRDAGTSGSPNDSSTQAKRKSNDSNEKKG